MKQRWVEYGKKADFAAWGEALSVSPLTARLIRNRGAETIEEARRYLYAGMESLSDPFLMKDMEKGASLIADAVREHIPIAVVSDFDDDGIFSGQILREGLAEIGGDVRIYTPGRVSEGYGINVRIIDEAKRGGCGLILTCDNGIAAVKEIAYAHEQGLKVVVTDHHEVQEVLPPADALIDPKQPDSEYPFRFLCGAGVAFRLIGVLYREFGIPEERLSELLEYVAIATVADVVELQGENRVLVKEGLRRLRNTKKIPLLSLMDVCGIEKEKVDAYHIGFIIGPCFNAVGRLSDAELAFRLLNEKDPARAHRMAQEMRELNEERKRMTDEGQRAAEEEISRGGLLGDRVLLVRLHGIHESVVGIIAGRLKEKYGRPVFVFTDSGEDLKGSGRSVPAYHMLKHLLPVSGLLLRFGGHAMAAGLSLRPEKLEELRLLLNARCEFSLEELLPPVMLDARLPISQISGDLIRELECLKPFGTANPRPLFARPHFRIEQARVLGKNRNVLKMVVSDGSGPGMEALLFGEQEIQEFFGLVRSEFGEEELQKLLRGASNRVDLAFLFYPEINEYQGRRSLQIVCTKACRIG